MSASPVNDESLNASSTSKSGKAASSWDWFNLPNLPATLKALFTGYLLVIGVGLCMAGLQILLTHGMADGKFGLSVDDIVYSYYGDRSGSKLEGMLNGAMKNNAPADVRLDIIKWAREGAPQDKWDSHYKEVFGKYCTVCHGSLPNIPDFHLYENVKKDVEVNKGASIESLTRVSHIHLFGISFIFFFMSLIFSLAVGIPRKYKVLAIVLPFAFLIVDVSSWWLTKLSPGFAWLTIIGGIMYSLASTFMWCTSMYQMFILSRNGKIYGNAWEQDL